MDKKNGTKQKSVKKKQLLRIDDEESYAPVMRDLYLPGRTHIKEHNNPI